MMQQYLEIKEKNSDSLLFFRLGDFYEMFFEDAVTASKELDLVLTGRDCGLEERAPMCGVPHHACEAYISRLVSRGYKVAICEQMQDPSECKGLVERDVVRIVTPGTILDSTVVGASENNFLCTVSLGKKEAAICSCDIGTGEIELSVVSGENLNYYIIAELQRISPSEVLLQGTLTKKTVLRDFICDRLGAMLTEGHDDYFDYDHAVRAVCEQFETESVSALGFQEECAVCAAGAMLSYLHATQKTELRQINHVRFLENANFMRLDMTARRNLELCETMRTGERRGSLLWVLDKTKTPMGGRLIRQWINKPLCQKEKILPRQNAIEALVINPIVSDGIARVLCDVSDLERLVSRVVCKSASYHDLFNIQKTLEKIPELKTELVQLDAPEMVQIRNHLDPVEEIRDLLSRSIEYHLDDDGKEVFGIKTGYHEEIDHLKNIRDNAMGMVLQMEAQEREKTGIKTLKIRYNRVFGYYIEVSKSYLDLVPEEYIRKQTLANGERYFTQELKELESSILGASDRLQVLERQVFNEVCREISLQLVRFQNTAKQVAYLDVVLSLATVASEYRYVRPQIDESDICEISDGRHPVVERMMRDIPFVPNDTYLDCGENRVALITGPNMAGKSTYMRQVALIVLMAQIGSFVPAKAAHIGLVDRIFTRIGASDDLSAGQSTFMVEMSEVADILTNATSRSLLVLDEIGRGTSTFDGMSIARAVIEYAADKGKLGAKTLFATHYHELTDLEGSLDGVKNYNIVVKKRGFDITFLRKIVRGPADESYGIEVAKLAGVPSEVFLRAKEILNAIESGDTVLVPHAIRAMAEKREEVREGSHVLIEQLAKLNADTLTPIEALGLLHQFSLDAKKLEDRK
ncbi:MAG: DNA mismatch repair protein MutS [Oscillospiraceae bacterium]|nr:DNA mismatch repair protein MutS [Oscillospiraceae bacterium]